LGGDTLSNFDIVVDTTIIIILVRSHRIRYNVVDENQGACSNDRCYSLQRAEKNPCH
jgi:hypothetical protein